MPAIRDVSWAATTAATGTTLVIPTPAYAQNDLLLAIFMADTAAGDYYYEVKLTSAGGIVTVANEAYKVL